jgi:hypothetical protein
MSAYKKLNRQDVYVTDYVAKKLWYATGSLVQDYKIETLRGFSGSTPGYPYPTDLRNNRYEKLVYNSAYQNYYANYSGSINGSTVYSGSYNISMQTTLDLSGSRVIKKEVGIISIPKEVYGIAIEPGTVVIEPSTEEQDKYCTDGFVSDEWTGRNQFIENNLYWYNSSPIDRDDYIVSESSYIEETIQEYVDVTKGYQRIEVVDDGEGRLIISGSEDEFTLNERHVGDIIYTQGQIIFTDPIVARYYSTYSRHKVKWKSKQPIYTYNVHCTVRESELNHTYNPSALTGSNNTIADNISGSVFRPYITTVGLYNEANELIAVAKTNRPIPKSENVDMTFVIKIDI